jgi:hypothetical protein
MAKEVKSRNRFYLTKSKLDFVNDTWTVDGKSIESVINNAIEFFNSNRVVETSNVFDYYNVAYIIDRLHASEHFLIEDITLSWIDMFHDSIASAIFIEAYTCTPGTEKAKYKVTEPLLAKFQKTFG